MLFSSFPRLHPPMSGKRWKLVDAEEAGRHDERCVHDVCPANQTFERAACETVHGLKGQSKEALRRASIMGLLPGECPASRILQQGSQRTPSFIPSETTPSKGVPQSTHFASGYFSAHFPQRSPVLAGARVMRTTSLSLTSAGQSSHSHICSPHPLLIKSSWGFKVLARHGTFTLAAMQSPHALFPKIRVGGGSWSVLRSAEAAV